MSDGVKISNIFGFSDFLKKTSNSSSTSNIFFALLYSSPYIFDKWAAVRLWEVSKYSKAFVVFGPGIILKIPPPELFKIIIL